MEEGGKISSEKRWGKRNKHLVVLEGRQKERKIEENKDANGMEVNRCASENENV